MILRFVLSESAKGSLKSSAWIDGYDYQNKDTKNITIMKKISPFFQCSV